jgi:hypothetical protein
MSHLSSPDLAKKTSLDTEASEANVKKVKLYSKRVKTNYTQNE